jgi:glycosyltransferase involved in cell wall biosynthesis
MKKENAPTVCLISCLHSVYDDRIYWKQAISLKNAGYNVIHVGVGDREFDIISEHGIRLIQIERLQIISGLFLNSFLKYFSSKSEYKQLLKIAFDVKADVYHLHDLQLNKIARKIKSFSFKPKIIYDVHEPYPITIADGEYGNRLTRIFMKIYSRYIYYWELKTSADYDLIIATEENVANKFKRHFPKKKIEIIYNFSDWDVSKLTSHEMKKYDFIYAGGIRRRRGTMQMLKAVAHLKNEGFNVRLLILGSICDTGLEDEMRKFIDANHISEQIKLLPPVPYQEIARYYTKSKCGIAIFNNSLVNQTILPIKILEYIAFGLPVICNNTGHMAQITQKYNTGLIVNHDNIEEISSAMKRLLTDQTLYDIQKNNCLNLYHAKFNWRSMEKQLILLYGQLLSCNQTNSTNIEIL